MAANVATTQETENPAQYARIKEVIRQRTGIDLGHDKDYLIPARLAGLLKEHGLADYDDLASALGRVPQGPLTDHFVDRIATHETLFFRDESIYGALTAQIIPEWMGRNAGNSRKLRIWSAACSTGQEPYSIAMVIRHLLPHVFERTEILATDISAVSLDRARAGLYTKYEIGRGVGQPYLERFFREHPGGYQVSDEIRSRVRFEPRNLLEMPFPGDFDLVLCRNVLIYFDLELRRKILEHIRAALRADGVLILGSAEGLDGYLTNYVLRECGLARYYDLNASKVTLL